MQVHIQTGDFSFEELEQQNPEYFTVLPDSIGLIGDIMYQVIVEVSTVAIVELIKYIVKKCREKHNPGTRKVRFTLPDKATFEIVCSESITEESVRRTLQEHDIIN